MATEIDHQVNKNRIKAILEASATFFDEKGADSKVRIIRVGRPDNDALNSLAMPYVIISNNVRFEEEISQGLAKVSTGYGKTTHIVRYDILCMVEGNDGQEAEQLADDKHKALKEILKADVHLAGASTPLVEEFKLTPSEGFVDRRGKNINGFKITLEARIITE